MSATTVTRYIAAPRERVYRTFLQPRAVSTWMVPAGMSNRVHDFDSREGGYFRISLINTDGGETGEPPDRMPPFHGQFTELIPNERIVAKLEFETSNPEMRGQMTITIALSDSNGGTELVVTQEGLPPAFPPAENIAGWEESLAQLAELIENETEEVR